MDTPVIIQHAKMHDAVIPMEIVAPIMIDAFAEDYEENIKEAMRIFLLK